MIDYINLFEEKSIWNVEDSGHNIRISLTGYLNNPQMKGITPKNQ